MPGILLPVTTDVYRYNDAARACDSLAGKLEEQAGKVRQLQGQASSAWRGDGGDSLSRAVGDRAAALTNAAGLLRNAARSLRAAKEAHSR
jgi:uncharacterized protein YukE